MIDTGDALINVHELQPKGNMLQNEACETDTVCNTAARSSCLEESLTSRETDGERCWVEAMGNRESHAYTNRVSLR